MTSTAAPSFAEEGVQIPFYFPNVKDVVRPAPSLQMFHL